MRYPGIEVLKWLGLASMVYDHVDAFTAVTLPFASHIGAVAFPFFVYAMFGGLADAPSGKAVAVVRRMFAWAVIAQVAVIFVRDGVPLNVLFMLASSLGLAQWFRVTEGRCWTEYLAALLLLFLAILSEFALAGVLFALVVAGEVWRGWSRWWSVAAAIPLFAFNELSFAACAAAIAASILSRQGPTIARIPRIFYPLYVLQWPLLRLL